MKADDQKLREKLKIASQCEFSVNAIHYTMLQKLSKCEVKAWLCWNLNILPPLRFYVKSNFGEFKKAKNVNFDNFKGSEFLF